MDGGHGYGYSGESAFQDEDLYDFSGVSLTDLMSAAVGDDASAAKANQDDDEDWFPPTPPPYDVTDKLMEVNSLHVEDPMSAVHVADKLRWRPDSSLVEIRWLQEDDAGLEAGLKGEGLDTGLEDRLASPVCLDDHLADLHLLGQLRMIRLDLPCFDCGLASTSASASSPSPSDSSIEASLSQVSTRTCSGGAKRSTNNANQMPSKSFVPRSNRKASKQDDRATTSTCIRKGSDSSDSQAAAKTEAGGSDKQRSCSLDKGQRRAMRQPRSSSRRDSEALIETWMSNSLSLPDLKLPCGPSLTLPVSPVVEMSSALKRPAPPTGPPTGPPSGPPSGPPTRPAGPPPSCLLRVPSPGAVTARRCASSAAVRSRPLQRKISRNSLSSNSSQSSHSTEPDSDSSWQRSVASRESADSAFEQWKIRKRQEKLLRERRSFLQTQILRKQHKMLGT